MAPFFCGLCIIDLVLYNSVGGRLSEQYLIDNQLRGPDSSSTLKKADETNLK